MIDQSIHAFTPLILASDGLDPKYHSEESFSLQEKIKILILILSSIRNSFVRRCRRRPHLLLFKRHPDLEHSMNGVGVGDRFN